MVIIGEVFALDSEVFSFRDMIDRCKIRLYSGKKHGGKCLSFGTG